MPQPQKVQCFGGPLDGQWKPRPDEKVVHYDVLGGEVEFDWQAAGASPGSTAPRQVAVYRMEQVAVGGVDGRFLFDALVPDGHPLTAELALKIIRQGHFVFQASGETDTRR